MALGTRIDEVDWDAVLRKEPAGALWRRHSDAVNTRLVERWLEGRRLGRVLKTDLWDEALADGVAPALARFAEEVHGIDVAPLTVAAAARRHPWLECVEADVRHVGAQDGEYDAILSLSTLDHLPDRAAVADALAEIRRVLAPGGELLLTFDNGANPVVAVRNRLPDQIRSATRLVPYPVSIVMRAGELSKMLARAGFEVLEVAAALHCPRVLAVPLSGRTKNPQRTMRRLAAWERLGSWPTRQVSGHFVVVRARRA